MSSHKKAAVTSPSISPVAIVTGLLLALAFSATPPLVAQSAPRVSALLAQGRELIRQGRNLDAFEVFAKAVESSDQLPDGEVVLREEARWELAVNELDFCKQLSSIEQTKKMAAQAHEAWQAYLDWYHGLTEDQKNRLKSSGHNRINRASALLGVACLQMKSPQDALDDYSTNVNIDDLGPDAIGNWKSALYQCPEWSGERGDRAQQRRRRICDESCKDYWVTYASSLRDWASRYSLRKEVRQQYESEAESITRLAKDCSP